MGCVGVDRSEKLRRKHIFDSDITISRYFLVNVNLTFLIKGYPMASIDGLSFPASNKLRLHEHRRNPHRLPPRPH